jgi:plasmid stabilization system protein ParE
MSLPVVLSLEARREFDDAFDWYERQRPGRGDTFAEAIKRVLDQIELVPESHPIIYRDIRRAVVQRFPYLIYYRILSGYTAVIAVVHGKRDQGFWRTRT